MKRLSFVVTDIQSIMLYMWETTLCLYGRTNVFSKREKPIQHYGVKLTVEDQLLGTFAGLWLGILIDSFSDRFFLSSPSRYLLVQSQLWEQVSGVALVSFMLTLRRFLTLFQCFQFLCWTSRCRLGGDLLKKFLHNYQISVQRFWEFVVAQFY